MNSAIVLVNSPAAEKIAAQIVSLPMYPQLTPSQQAWVVEECHRFTAQSVCAPLSS